MLEKNWAQIILFLLCSLVLITLRFGSWFGQMNRVVEPYGDGFKAYTAIQYHATHDSTLSHFEGMNYPYGEHAIPAVSQPLVSNSINLFSKAFVDVRPYTVAIVNGMMLLSVLLCSLFLFLIFRKLKLPLWYATCIALGITFLSPQIHRMIAHYGLAHLEAIPILLYLLLGFNEKMEWKYSVGIAVLALLLPLIHFYYFAIFAFTVSFYFLFKFLFQPTWKHLLKCIPHYAVQIIIPLSFFVYWLILNDPVHDRTPEPWGFFAYHTLWEGVVTSMDQPYFRWIDQKIIDIRPMGYENKSYIGIVAFFTSLVMIGAWLKRKNKRQIFEFKHGHRDFLSIIFWTAFVILIIALGLPFTINGLEFLLDYTGPFRQFRSVGRYAWLFYYVVNIIVFTWLYEQLASSKYRNIGLALIIAVLAFEAYNSAYSWNLDLDVVEELEPGQSFLETTDIDYDQYQAILTVPYYNIGSDQFYWEPEGFIIQKSLTLSIQTGLPVTSAAITRSSRSQTLEQMQFVTEPYRYPVLLDTLPNQKPLLMLLDQREYEKEKERYEHLLDGAELIYSKGDRLRLYKLPLASFEERLENRVLQVNEIIAKDTTLKLGDNNKVAVPDSLGFYYDPMDDRASARSYLGTGAYEGLLEQVNTIDIPNLQSQKAEEDYELSIWLYIADDRRTHANFTLSEYDQNDQLIRQHSVQGFRAIDLFDNNGWALLEMDFKPAASNSRFQLTFSYPRLRKAPVYLDELLIRPKSIDIY
ncbi:MAG: hypothetical protein AAF705_09920, partial [Bacteroidota bacterium]